MHFSQLLHLYLNPFFSLVLRDFIIILFFKKNNLIISIYLLFVLEEEMQELQSSVSNYFNEIKLLNNFIVINLKLNALRIMKFMVLL